MADRQEKRGKAPVVVGAVVVAVLMAGCATYWFVLRDDAPPVAELGNECAIAGDTSSADGDWLIARGDDTFVAYRIPELFGGETIKKDAFGKTPAVEGSMTLSGDEVTSLQVDADMTQLSSDQGRRDLYLAKNALQTEQFPAADFALKDPVALPTTPVAGTTVGQTITGLLTLHGESRMVEVPVKACWGGDTITVTGTQPIDLADYGIEAPSVGGFVEVDDTGQLELSLTFVRS